VSIRVMIDEGGRIY